MIAGSLGPAHHEQPPIRPAEGTVMPNLFIPIALLVVALLHAAHKIAGLPPTSADDCLAARLGKPDRMMTGGKERDRTADIEVRSWCG